MASPLVDAFTAQLVAGLDPMHGVIRQMADTQNERGLVETLELKSNAIDKIEKLISAAKDRQASTSVLDAYDRILARLTTS